MKLYSYYLVWPLDWEFAFLSIDEYKSILKQKYYQNEISNKHFAGELSEVYALIDEMLTEAKKDFKEKFNGYDDLLRCPPMIFPIPKGDSTNAVAFCIVLKRDEDGDTVVYSHVPLTYLEN